jgi:predicted Zn finger-like uncharacterized protein
MHGTTACPHCDTRFKVTKAQLEAHHGMVRCGHCLQPFDIHPNFAPDQLDLELDLPVLDNTEPDSSQADVQQPMTLAEQVTIVRDDDSKFLAKRRTWPWAIAALLLLLVLLAQSAYFFRVDLAARLPGLKPTLIGYCRLLKCRVPLPQHTDLIGLESSELEADPVNENQITLDALLRNRAPYAQAFPNLELTLNDIQDKPLARRVFIPADYLPTAENEPVGLSPNHEVSIKLHLNTTGIKPSGYRLMLLYSNN